MNCNFSNSRGNNATANTGNTTPNQSKSFRILQKITSTEDNNEDLVDEANHPAELQKPHYSRMMANSPQQQTNNAAIEQLQRMQLNSDRIRQGKRLSYYLMKFDIDKYFLLSTIYFDNDESFSCCHLTRYH